MANLIERHAQKRVGVLCCFDRLMLQGALPSVAYPQAVATELDRRDIRLFDYAKQFALPFREAIRAHTERLAAEEGVGIEFIQRMKNFRKEDRIQQILVARGSRPGLVPCCRSPILSPSRLARPLSLDHHAGRVRHRYRLPKRNRSRSLYDHLSRTAIHERDEEFEHPRGAATSPARRQIVCRTVYCGQRCVSWAEINPPDVARYGRTCPCSCAKKS